MAVSFRFRDKGFGVQPFGGERRFQGRSHTCGRRGRIERGRAVAEVERECGRSDAGRGTNLDGAAIADRLGGLLERRLRSLGQIGADRHDEARGGFDFARQALQGRLDRSLRELGEGGVGDRAGAGQGEFGRTHAMFVRDPCQLGQGLTDAAGDLREGLGLEGGHRGQGLALTLGEGLGAEHLDLVGGEQALGPLGGVGDVAGVVEHRVETEFLMGRAGHQ